MSKFVNSILGSNGIELDASDMFQPYYDPELDENVYQYMQPLVSIALCTYNTGPFLLPLLNSLLQQSWENTEIVCCDDKSSDDTVKTLEKFRQQFPGKIRVYQNKANLGYIKNFEQCLSLCSGEWIAIADHDDAWKPQKLEMLLNAIGDAMLVYSDSVLIDEAGKETGKKISDRFRLHDHPHPNAFAFYDFTWGHTMLLKKGITGICITNSSQYAL